MTTKLNILDPEPSADNVGFSLSEESDGIELNDLNANANGGTEMMQRGLYERLPDDIKDEVQIICSRVRNIDTHRPTILWLHDLFMDPEAQHLSDENSRKRFDRLVFVSDWQWNTYHLAHGIPHAEAVTFKNCIEPIPTHTKQNDRINLIYHTTPHRGLEILVPVYKELSKKYGDSVHLDVYSSFNAYGWPQRDEPYKELFEEIEQHDHMTYHGYQPNDVVRKAIEEAHIFAYPSIWQETSCIAAMEAMSGGLGVVCPAYAALPETTANLGYMYQFHHDPNVHANIFASALNSVVDLFQNNYENIVNRLQFQKAYADNFYNWDIRAKEWETLIRKILEHKK